MRPSRNPAVPIEGRTWYDGAWRTPTAIERRRDAARARQRARRSDPAFVAAENKQARDRMRRLHRRVEFHHGAPKPTPAALREAATIDAVLALVEESIRDDARRYVYSISLDAPLFEADEPETFLDRLADPEHWREPGFEAAA